MTGQSTETVAKPGVNLDELQQEAEKLVVLLKNRQPGLPSWNQFLGKRITVIHQMTGQALVKT